MPAAFKRDQRNALSAIDAQELLFTAKAFKSLDDKAVMRQLRKSLRTAAAPVQAKAKAIASGFSSTIAGTVTVQTAFTAKRSGVYIVAVRKKMPAGHEPLPGLFERGGQKNSRLFSHPLFGNRDFWFRQPIHPFLKPALTDSKDAIVQQLRQDVAELLRQSGLTID